MPIYYTNNNGDKNFKVDVDKNIVKIFIKQNKTYELDPILKFDDIEHAFIGYSPINEMTLSSRIYGSDFDGNSILIHRSNNEYIFIGHKIFIFQALDKIHVFISPIGYNAISYPYAIDESNNYYLLKEDVILKNCPMVKNPYSQYYDYNQYCQNKSNGDYQQLNPNILF